MPGQKQSATKPTANFGTTGHEWDGIEELNTPLPRWWLWLFYATVVWSVAYWVVYPAWPLISSYSNGLFNWHTRSASRDPTRAELQQQRGPMMTRLLRLRCRRSSRPRSCSTLPARWASALSPTIARPATAPAAGAPRAIPISTTTTGCGAARRRHSQTITHGVRSGDDAGHQGSMPAFGRDGCSSRIRSRPFADYVRSLSGLSAPPGADLHERRQDLRRQLRGLPRPAGQGQPRTRRAQSHRQYLAVRAGQEDDHGRNLQRTRRHHAGLDGKLDDVTIKALAVYVHTFGGGEQ